MSRRTKSNPDTAFEIENEALLKSSDKSKILEDEKDNDLSNILLLMLLYILQGIPLGLAGSIPMILQQKHVSYKDQATFSLAFWPFSVKLLWAPIVDSCFWKSMGRRKSWLVPAQYLIGISMLVLSVSVDSLLAHVSTGSFGIYAITSAFFFLNFLAATQDVAVDGWAITMLSRRNVGWASTCNSVGQTTGFFLGYVVFLALESTDFCVNYLGQTEKLVTLPGFFLFWGIVFIITTTLVWILKTEKPEIHLNNELGMIQTYKLVGRLLQMAPIKKIIMVLLTMKIGFAAADSLTVLKLTEIGVPKEDLALLALPLTPLQIFLPLFISKYTSGPMPLRILLLSYVPRLFLGIIFAGLVYITPMFEIAKGNYSYSFFLIVIAVYVLHQICATSMFVSLMSFYARVSDSSVGGSYMTLLNTFTNLGGNWVSWAALSVVSDLTVKECVKNHSLEKMVFTNATCQGDSGIKVCEDMGANCSTIVDGFYVESVLCIIIGLLWYKLWGRNALLQLQSTPPSEWALQIPSKSVR